MLTGGEQGDEKAVTNLDNDYELPHFRLRIGHLFYAVTFYAAGLAVSSMLIIPTTIWLVFSFLADQQSTRRRSFGIWGFAFSLGFFGLCCLMAPMTTYPIVAAQRSQCFNNVRQILLALHNYEAAHAKLPKARTLDANGKPAHSWRVLILPYIEESDLYKRYSFDEPWDGPNNRKLAKEMPQVYRCPMHDHGHKTHYKLVTGPETLFVDDKLPSFNHVIDGTSNTVILVEDPGSAVNWMEPDDLTIDEAIRLFSEPEVTDVPHFHKGPFQYSYYGSSVGRLDGSVDHFGVNLDPDELRRVFGIDNGVPADDFDYFSKAMVVPRYGAIVSAWIYLALVLLPVILTFFKKDRVCGVIQDGASQKNELEGSTKAKDPFSGPDSGT